MVNFNLNYYYPGGGWLGGWGWVGGWEAELRQRFSSAKLLTGTESELGKKWGKIM